MNSAPGWSEECSAMKRGIVEPIGIELHGWKKEHGPNRDVSGTKKPLLIYKEIEMETNTCANYLWFLLVLVATCKCLPVFTWGIGELHVETWTTCVYLCLHEKQESYMWTLGLLVSTCVYLRDRRATCAQLDYLCLTCAYLKYLCLHLNSCCIESLPLHTFCTCGMNSLSNINLPVSQKNVSPLGNVLILEKNKCRNVQKCWCSFGAVLMQFWCSFETASFWCTYDVVSWVLMHFWCSFQNWHQNCIKTASCFLKTFIKISRKYVKISKNYDAVLMQFWSCIILMHFWCSFKGFWCTFDAVFKTASKLHQNCIMFFDDFHQNFKKNM